jgi:hypothetical protein
MDGEVMRKLALFSIAPMLAVVLALGSVKSAIAECTDTAVLDADNYVIVGVWDISRGIRVDVVFAIYDWRDACNQRWVRARIWTQDGSYAQLTAVARFPIPSTYFSCTTGNPIYGVWSAYTNLLETPYFAVGPEFSYPCTNSSLIDNWHSAAESNNWLNNLYYPDTLTSRYMPYP